MMDQWRPFDIRTFLKESRNWDKEIERLEYERDNMSLLPSSGGQRIAGKGEVSDLTAKVALRRLEISSEIEKLRLNKEMLAFAMKVLPEQNKQLIEGFYYPTKPISVFVDEYGLAHGMGRTAIYQERENTERIMARCIERNYYD